MNWQELVLSRIRDNAIFINFNFSCGFSTRLIIIFNALIEGIWARIVRKMVCSQIEIPYSIYLFCTRQSQKDITYSGNRFWHQNITKETIIARAVDTWFQPIMKFLHFRWVIRNERASYLHCTHLIAYRNQE